MTKTPDRRLRELERAAGQGDRDATVELDRMRRRLGMPPLVDYAARAQSILDALNEGNIPPECPWLEGEGLEDLDQDNWRGTPWPSQRFLILTNGVCASHDELWIEEADTEEGVAKVIETQLFLDWNDPLPWYTVAVIDLLFMEPLDYRACIDLSTGQSHCGPWRLGIYEKKGDSPDAECSRCHRRYWSGDPDAHPTLAYCPTCYERQRRQRRRNPMTWTCRSCERPFESYRLMIPGDSYLCMDCQPRRRNPPRCEYERVEFSDYSGPWKGDKKTPKRTAFFTSPAGRSRRRTIHFGLQGYEDYTMHHDDWRREKYLERHGRGREDWDRCDTAGSLSRWILWGDSTSRAENERAFRRRFRLKNPPRPLCSCGHRWGAHGTPEDPYGGCQILGCRCLGYHEGGLG